MPRRTICTLAVWAGLAGTATAQWQDTAPGWGTDPSPTTADEAPWPRRAGNWRRSPPPPPPAGPTRVTTGPTPPPQTEPRKDSPAPGTPPTPAQPGQDQGPGCAAGVGAAGLAAGSCGPPGRYWSSFDLLVWATSGQHVPAAITTSPPGTPPNIAGVPTGLDTATVYGNQRANNDFRGGFRLTAGLWLDDDHRTGIEGDFLVVHDSRQGFSAGSDASNTGVPILARPFFNVVTGLPDAALVSYPGLFAGRIDVRAESRPIGGGVNLLRNLYCDPCGRLDFVAGYRYFGVSDDLTFSQNLTTLVPLSVLPPGSRLGVFDQFRTANNFNGGLIGLAGERRFGHWFVGGRATIAFGGVQQVVNIDGSTAVTLPARLPAVFPGGLYTPPASAGRHEQGAFAVLPELGLRVGVQLTGHARLYIGYNWLYLSSVARAGDQVDARLNPALLPPRPPVGVGPPPPAFGGIHTTDFWMQGVTLGAELRF